jgi:hypothetical protein
MMNCCLIPIFGTAPGELGEQLKMVDARPQKEAHASERHISCEERGTLLSPVDSIASYIDF